MVIVGGRKPTAHKNIFLYRDDMEVDYVRPTEENIKRILGTHKYNEMKKNKPKDKRCFMCESYDITHPFFVVVCRKHIRDFVDRIKDYEGGDDNIILKRHLKELEWNDYCQFGHKTKNPERMARFEVFVCANCMQKIYKKVKEWEESEKNVANKKRVGEKRV